MLIKDTLPALVPALMAAAADLSDRVMRRLPVAVVARLDAGTQPIVMLRTGPLAARVFAETDDGEILTVGELTSSEIPPALDAATSRFLACALDRLPANVAAWVRQQLTSGAGRLALTVTAFPASVELIFAVGADVHMLARALPGDTRAH